MLPHLSNMIGLWGLLGIPLIVAIHFLRHKTKEQLTSTMFLLEVLSPEDRTGRFWDRLRTSRTFWLQILCVLLLTWVLVSPQWVRENTSRPVIFVVDDSISMSPFRQEAIQAVAKRMGELDASGIPSIWTIMPSSSRNTSIYRGTNAREALTALGSWEPRSGTHDPAPALRTAEAVAGKIGITHFITNNREMVPPAQSATGIGKPLDNTGFAGITPQEQSAMPKWRIAVRNNAATPQERELTVRIPGKESKPSTRTLKLNPQSVVEFDMVLPNGVDSMELTLTPDAFPEDDSLTLVRPQPHPVAFSINLKDQAAANSILKLAQGIPGFRKASPTEKPQLSIISGSQYKPQQAPEPAIVLAANSMSAPPQGSITPEKHPLTEGLGWGSLLIAAPGDLTPEPMDTILLWHGETPLAWLHGNRLVLNWQWEKSNADRIPAPLLAIRRFMGNVQDKAPGTLQDNVPSGTRLDFPHGSRMTVTRKDGSVRHDIFKGTTPEESCLIRIDPSGDDAQPLFKGSVWFADTRQSDFTRCCSFEQIIDKNASLLEQMFEPDPFVPFWIFLAGCCMLGSWFTPASERRNQA